MTAHYATHDDIAVLTLDNPPVNGMGLATRTALAAGLARAEADPTLHAIVIAGHGKLFSGGADIREFGKPQALEEPNLLQLIDAIESSAKPVVASLHGTCMGGGLELALACHYRVADAATQIGLPEVKIGLLPGAGGTQRLPRAVGLETALAMIVSGEPRTAEALAAIPGQRLLDRVVHGAPLEAAIALAREAASRGAPHQRLRDVRVESADPAAALAAARASIGAAASFYPAPGACIDAIEAALGDFDAGIAREREGFATLMRTPESRALRHAFFAERASARVADVPDETPKRAVERVAVIGAGTMGSGIAYAFLAAGFPVTLVETTADALARGVASIEKIVGGAVKKGVLRQDAAAARLAALKPTLDLADLRDADLVVEAVFEDLAVKESVFRKIDAIAKPGAILASNTSTLDLDRIAAFTSRPADVIGLHFFSPAHVMKLLEIVRGRETAKDVLATSLALAKRVGKVAVVAGVCDGFIGNRMIEQYLRQAGFLLEEGALPQQVDAAMKAIGFAMGPFETSDLAGNDIGWAIRKRRYVEHPEQTYSRIADRVCELGRFGQKTGAGWYDYKPGDRAAYPNPLIEQTIVDESARMGIARRAIPDREIVERLVFALVNEGARILEEGIAAKAGDVDVVYLYGYGFPRFRGGPMRYADEAGLPYVVGRMREFGAADVENRQAGAWEPARLLVELAEKGGSFT